MPLVSKKTVVLSCRVRSWHNSSFSRRRRSSCNRSATLSITHIVDFQSGSKGYVVQPGEAAPHDDITRRRILGACEIDAKPCDLDEIERERSGRGRIGGWIGDQAIEDVRLQLGQHQGRFKVRLGSVEHRQPEHAPAQDTEHREQPDQPLSSSQSCLLGPTARFQDLVKDLDLPAVAPINPICRRIPSIPGLCRIASPTCA